VTFVPEQRPDSRLPSGLAGIASQFGISIGGEASQSPRFYAELVKSRELLERLLLSSYADARQGSLGSADSVALISLLGVKGRDQSDSVQNGVRALDKLVSIKVDNQTEQRITEGERELRDAEESLRAFYDRAPTSA